MAEAVGAPKGAGWDLNSRIALGTAEVSPLNQANAYATFANDGTYVAPHVVKEVKDANGKVVYKAAPEEKRAVEQGRRPRRDVRADQRGRAGDREHRADPGSTGGRQDRHQGRRGRHRLRLVRRLHPADLHRGDVRRRGRRQRRPRRLRASRRLHLLRRHVPGPHLGRLHADRRRGPAGEAVRGAGVRQPRLCPAADRHLTAGARSHSDPGADDRGADPGTDHPGADQQQPTTEAPTQEPTTEQHPARSRPRSGRVASRPTSPPAAADGRWATTGHRDRRQRVRPVPARCRSGRRRLAGRGGRGARDRGRGAAVLE